MQDQRIDWWKTLGADPMKGSYRIGGGNPSEYVVREGKEFFSESLSGVSCPQLLDLGVWEGRHLPILKTLAGQKGQVFGVDHPNSKVAVDHASQSHPDVEFRLARFVSLPFEPRQLDGVLCWRTLHNLVEEDELRFCMSELARVVKRNRPVVISVLAEQGQATWPRLRRGVNSAGNPRDAWHFSSVAVTACLCHYGNFQIIGRRKILEGSIIDGVPVQTAYWAVHLIRR